MLLYVQEPITWYVIYEIPCTDEDMSNPDEALDILWELICMDSMPSQDFLVQPPSEQKYSTDLKGWIFEYMY